MHGAVGGDRNHLDFKRTQQRLRQAVARRRTIECEQVMLPMLSRRSGASDAGAGETNVMEPRQGVR